MKMQYTRPPVIFWTLGLLILEASTLTHTLTMVDLKRADDEDLYNDPGAANPIEGILYWMEIFDADSSVNGLMTHFNFMGYNPYGNVRNDAEANIKCPPLHSYTESDFCSFQISSGQCTISETRNESDRAFATSLWNLKIYGITFWDLPQKRDLLGTAFVTTIRDECEQNNTIEHTDKCRLYRAITLRELMMQQLIPLRLLQNDMAVKYVYQAWNRHPFLNYFCAGEDLLVDYIKILDNFTRTDILAYLNIWDMSVTMVIRDEIDKVCKTSPSDPFCIYEKVIVLTERMRELVILSKEIPTNSEVLKAVDISVKFALHDFLKDTGDEFKDINVDSRGTLYMQATQLFFSLLMKHNLEDAHTSLNLFRELETSHLQENSINGPIDDALLYNLKKIMELTRIFSSVKNSKTKVLNTNVDFKVLLVNQQMNHLLDLVKGQKSDLINIANNMKTEIDGIKSYFVMLESFNKDKSTADIELIKSLLFKFKVSSQKLQTEVGTNVDKLLEYALGAASAQAVEYTFKLATTIAEACNPLKAAISGGTVTDVMEAAAELANSVADITTVTALMRALTDLVEKSNIISKGFQTNENLLIVISRITDNADSEDDVNFESDKEAFLEAYANYGSAVDKPELEALEEYWNSVVDAACGIIKDTEAAASAIVKGIVFGGNLCVKTKTYVKKMMATFSEMYDFQEELIESIATYMRSLTGMNAAKSINADIENTQHSQRSTEEKMILMQQTAALTLLTHKYQTWRTTEDYCDILEYKNGGEKPDVCNGWNTSVAALVANAEYSCDNEIRMFVNIPTIPEGNGKHSYINLTNLYNEEEITFQVPNEQWLRKHGWIGISDNIKAAYVKEFEVYAPTATLSFRRVKSSVTTPYTNVLFQDGPKYRISPQKNMNFHYQEGRNVHNCRKGKFQNPYTKCVSSDISYICPLSNDITACEELKVKTMLFPSIYSTLKIKLEGYKFDLVPNPATELPLKVGILMCAIYEKASPEHQLNSRRSLGTSDADLCTRTCCPDNQYSSTTSGVCTACPPNSISALGGYYCEKKTEN